MVPGCQVGSLDFLSAFSRAKMATAGAEMVRERINLFPPIEQPPNCKSNPDALQNIT